MTPSDLRSQPRAFRPIAALLRRAGLADGARRMDLAPATQAFERLEDRVFLAGDEPGLADVFNTPNPLPVPEIMIVGGVGTTTPGMGSSTIAPPSPLQDDDVFRFTAPATDFVRVWADTLNATGSLLDSRVEVYTGTPGGVPTLIASGSNQGMLTSGTFTDGWAGFLAQAGQTYYIRVISDQIAGGAASGDYILRINTLSQAFPALNPATGLGQANGTISLPGSDVVYRLTTGSDAAFDSLMTLIAKATATDLDTRLDIYNAQGMLIAADSDAGNLSNAYVALKSNPDQTFFVRVRSDEFGNPATRPSTGNFTLVVDGIATEVVIDPVTRLGPHHPPTSSLLPSAQDAHLYQFQAQGTGLSFITLNPPTDSLMPIPDSALRIYDDTGVQIGFNELPSPISRLEIRLTGGRTYYVVVENFGGSGGGDYELAIEAHHTYDPGIQSDPVDDHVNTPDFDPQQPIPFDVRQQFELATPIIWGDPEEATLTTMLPMGLPDPADDHSLVLRGRAHGRIHAAGDTDLFQFVAPVDMLGEFPGIDDEGMPPLWRPNYRPATSLQIISTAQTLFNSQIRIYDSNFELIYGPNDNTLTAPGDRAGILDPAFFPPELPIMDYGFTFAGGQPVRIDIWGGEVYYIEVSGSGTGHYDFEVQVDAYEDKPEVSVFGPRIPEAGQWGEAREILIDANTGEGRNYTNAAGGSLIPLPGGLFTAIPGNPTAGYQLTRGYAANLNGPPQMPPLVSMGSGATIDPNTFVGNPGTRGRVIFQISDLGLIQTPNHTELYQFRALYTGMAEVRIATTQITDEFFEGIANTEHGDPMMPPETSQNTKTKTYNSPLDAALRIFDNDQVEIAYNNDNNATAGESDTTFTGAFERTYQRRDPRVVFPVEAGRIYYIQVESGQRDTFNSNPDLVDWRHATGSYELLVNSMPNLNFVDDHVNADAAQATPIPVDDTISDPEAILGQVPGQIVHNLSNPNDADLFQFISVANGVMRITVSGDFGRTVSVFTEALQLLGTATQPGTADAEITIQAAQGERFYVLVEGSDIAATGNYVVKLSGLPFVDDAADNGNWAGAVEIDKDLYDYDGLEVISGRIDFNGDTDLFRFETIAFDTVTVTVEGLTPGFDPHVRIFEIGEDGVANPVFLQIAYNDDIAPGLNLNSRVTFSVTAPNRTSTTSGKTFNSYYIMVSGFDPDDDLGDYNLSLSFNVSSDDHPDALQYDIADVISLDPETGIGTSSGTIEVLADTDLFQFTTLNQGTTTITLTSPMDSDLFPRIRVFDQFQNPVATTGGFFFVTGPDQPVSQAVFEFIALRGVVYYVQVEGAPPGANIHKTSPTGQYTLEIVSPIPDDHANEGEFPIATLIPLSTFSGDGSASGELEIGTDSDLFRFNTLPNVAGLMRITISTPSSQFRPVLQLFGPDTVEIGSAVVDGGPGDEDGQVNGSVTRSISTALNTAYYLLVTSDQGEPVTTGAYIVTLDGNRPPQGPDDHANEGDWENATLIELSGLTGDASADGNLEINTDTDLFFFRSLTGSNARPRRAEVQVVTPTGSALNLSVSIYKETSPGVFELVVTDALGGPGTNAEVDFQIDTAGTRYFILVDGLDGTGTYTVYVDTEPETFFLYYPEGFANSNIREYISIGNENDFDVTVTIRLRYESNDPEHVITTVVPAHSRGGVTISDGTANPGSGVLFNVPYAIVLESDGFIAANISHYDFGNTLGEAFTGRTSTTWSFAQGERFPGQVADFLLYYNPNPTPAIVTLTAYQTDENGVVTTYTTSQVVQPFRRFGWNFNATPQLPLGKFSFVVTSAPENPGDTHIGIVAALSHNDLANSTGYAVLGDPDGGAMTGILPGVVSGNNIVPTLTVFNSSDTAATVNLVGRYINNAFPAITRSITLQPFESRALSADDLGLIAGQTVGFRYDANTTVTVLSAISQNGDADATQATTRGATAHYFGDAFINRLRAGTLYFENMYFYNPNVTDLPVTLRFIFNDGFESTHTFTVAAKDFAVVPLHLLQAAIGHKVFAYFSVSASAALPFVAQMNHYDLVLAGGWRATGAPLGLTTPLVTI